MKISKAELKDFQAILVLQYAAYQSEAIRYDNFSIPPLTQTLEQLIDEAKNGILLKATIENVIVGSVRGALNGTTCKIARLIVHPDLQGRGIGSHLLSEIESCFAGVERFELFTGAESYDNIRLYNRQGYTEFKQEKLNDQIRLVFLQKRNQLWGQKQAGKGAL